MELLRTHFANRPLGAPVITLEAMARQHAGQEDLEPSIATLCAMHDALVSSIDVHGAVQTFYPMSVDEQYQLACAVRYVMAAHDFSTAQSGLFMWMHSMSIFAHSVSPPNPNPDTRGDSGCPFYLALGARSSLLRQASHRRFGDIVGRRSRTAGRVTPRGVPPMMRQCFSNCSVFLRFRCWVNYLRSGVSTIPST